MTRRDPAGLGAVGPELVERPTREAAGTQAPEAGEQEVLHKVDSFLNSKHTHPLESPHISAPLPALKHSHVFEDHLAKTKFLSHKSSCKVGRMHSPRTSYFLKSPLCNLLLRSDSMSLFCVSFSLRSWKMRRLVGTDQRRRELKRAPSFSGA